MKGERAANGNTNVHPQCTKADGITCLVDIGPVKWAIILDPENGIVRAVGTKGTVDIKVPIEKDNLGLGWFKVVDDDKCGAGVWDIRLLAAVSDPNFNLMQHRDRHWISLKHDVDMMAWLHNEASLRLGAGRELRVLSGEIKIQWINDKCEVVEEPTWFRPTYAVWLQCAYQNWIRNDPDYTSRESHINEFTMTKIVMDAYARDLEIHPVWDEESPTLDGTDATVDYSSPFCQPEVKVIMEPW